jgi:ankyrin repeat protein
MHLVELLLKIDGINPNFQEEPSPLKSHLGDPPLILAVNEGHNAIVEMLLAMDNVDPDVRDYWNGSPLLSACRQRHVSIVKQLLARDDVDVNVKVFSETPLLMTCDNEWRPSDELGEEIARLLLDKAGIDINIPNMNGDTPLMLAARHRKMVVKSLLARNDLDPNIINADGDHALGYWAYKGDITAVKLLLGHPNTDLNLLTGGGRSALMLACMAGKVDVVKFLLSREGIAINQQDILNATRKKEALSHETIACILSRRRGASHLLNKGH